ncbi:unnamed protein product [Camellia sinensis]
MHFQRSEQEIESLKRKLTACTREKLNLQEELSEAYRIKVSKNMEAEKQVKFFQGCVASAFAERDHSIMEVTAFEHRGERMDGHDTDDPKQSTADMTVF